MATIAGLIVGGKAANKTYVSKFASNNYKQVNSYEKGKDERRALVHENLFEIAGNQALHGAIEGAGGVATSYASYKLADYICKKFDIK